MRGFCSKLLTQAADQSFSSISICLVAPPSSDGSPIIFKKPDLNHSDPRLFAAIADLFEIITCCFTPNTIIEQRRSQELLARINFMSDLSTTGNLSGAAIDMQVEFVNNMLFNFFHVVKTDPFRQQMTPDPALNVLYWERLTDTLIYSKADIKQLTTDAICFPKEARLQFGHSDIVPTPSSIRTTKRSASRRLMTIFLNRKPKIMLLQQFLL